MSVGVAVEFATAAPAANQAIGKTIPDFDLPDAAGKTRTLAEFADRKMLAVVFIGTECPLANLYLPELMDLAQRHQADGLGVVLVNSNEADTTEEIAAHAKEFGITVPVLCDREHKVADLFGAVRTPEVFLLDAKRVVRYEGRIDDRYGYFHKREDANRYDLEEAIKEVAAGKPVSVPATEVAGCMISRSDKETKAASITYAKDVSRVLQNKCQNCHRPGTSAPFSLLSYDDAVHWADTIKEAVLDKRMPPWHADPHHGTFRNDRRLTSAEIATLTSWVDAGTPKGDDADLPPPRTFDGSGWMIGQPDLVFQLPQVVTIPAKGVVPYQYYQTETKFEEDVWISAAEARPGNRAVNHHIIVFVKSPKANLFDPDARLGGFLVGTAPGDMPLELPPGYARKIPAGSTLVWQMHYTPTGKEETDRSEVGLVLYKGPQPPKGVALTKGISNRFFRIPAGADAHKVESEFTFSQDATLLSFMPHMHLRGKDFEYTAIFPDGTREVLLSVPKYDFNWQSTYRLAQPRHMPKGTKIHCVAHFDNSAANRANPDPTKPVFWGDQTWEEMMIGWIDFTYDQPGPTAQR
jgi:peroxiredoxin